MNAIKVVMILPKKKAKWIVYEAVFFAFSVILIFTYNYSNPTFLQMTTNLELV